MTGNKSSAVAQELIRYANTAADINGALNNEADKLWAALKTFAATCTEYKTGVGPDLAGELHAYVRRTAPTDAWVRQVGQDFAKADGGGRQHNAGAPTFAAMRLPPTLLRAAAFRDDPAKAEQAAPTSTSRQAGKEARTADGKALQKGSQNYAAYIQGVESAEDSARIWLGASLKPYGDADTRNKWAKRTSPLTIGARRGQRFKLRMGPEVSKLAGLSGRTKVHYKAKSPLPKGQLGKLTKAGARDAFFPKSALARKLWVGQLAATVYTDWKEFQGEPGDVRVAKTSAATAFDTAVQTGINVAATAAGTAAGGALGGALGGPIGAAIGARLGGLAGSMAGAWVSEQVMETDVMKDARRGFVNTVGGWFD